MILLFRILAFLKYKWSALSKYRLHSPFIYDFTVNVLNDRTKYHEYSIVEKLKKTLKSDKRSINKKDFGAGKPKEYLVSEIARYHSINTKTGRLLYRISRKLKPAIVLELGTSLGVSTSYIASASPESKIVTIEGCPSTAIIASENFSNLKFENIKLITGDFDSVLNSTLEEILEPSLVFIDGNHRREPVLKYFNEILKFASNDTLIIIDDIHWSSGMQQAWEEICENNEVTATIDIYFAGIVFLRKEFSKQNFVIKF